MISLPVCSSRDEILALKIRLDRFPGELEGGFRSLLKRAAPLLESLNLSTSHPGLWEMTRSICDSAEERLNRASPRVRPEIRKAMGYIQNHLAENIQRDTLGRLIHYDSVYFSKLFKTELGMSFTEYLLYMRMLRAQTLLCETDLFIDEVALQCGYTDSSYFKERFCQFCGMTPSEWRENNREAMG
jgi:YesN/AraC family two-component response regulator